MTIAPTYYGLMYALWFWLGYYLLSKRKVVSPSQLEDLFFIIFLGVIVWGRLWYILFYNPLFYLEHPLDILKFWNGWMSFHGWFLWVVWAVFFYCKRQKIHFWKIIDEIATLVPIWLWLGRIGNYLNKELLGFSPYYGPLAVEKGGISYFPSPLLESFLEGWILFLILYFINKNKKFYGKTAAYFALFYGIFRIIIELFFRSPDVKIGYIYWPFSLWFFYSLPLIGIGLYLLYRLKNNAINQ